VNHRDESRFFAERPSVLILSDDPEFARPVLARWQQSEKSAPEITVASSDTPPASIAARHDLIVAGFTSAVARLLLGPVLSAAGGRPVIYVTADASEALVLQVVHPHLLIVEKREEWVVNLILLANEILRRVHALARAHRAERSAVESQHYATLGRYMLDMRPGVNDALTSILGNADLLLFEPGQTLEKTREQIVTIHRMSLRLNQIMQRFSSLATEMQTTSDEFQPELVSASEGRAT
jgi:signal transduction histidine kinase